MANKYRVIKGGNTTLNCDSRREKQRYKIIYNGKTIFVPEDNFVNTLLRKGLIQDKKDITRLFPTNEYCYKNCEGNNFINNVRDPNFIETYNGFCRFAKVAGLYVDYRGKKLNVCTKIDQEFAKLLENRIFENYSLKLTKVA